MLANFTTNINHSGILDAKLIRDSNQTPDLKVPFPSKIPFSVSLSI